MILKMCNSGVNQSYWEHVLQKLLQFSTQSWTSENRPIQCQPTLTWDLTWYRNLNVFASYNGQSMSERRRRRSLMDCIEARFQQTMHKCRRNPFVCIHRRPWRTECFCLSLIFTSPCVCECVRVLMLYLFCLWVRIAKGFQNDRSILHNLGIWQKMCLQNSSRRFYATFLSGFALLLLMLLLLFLKRNYPKFPLFFSLVE